MRKVRLALTLSALIAGLFSHSASATTFDWSFSGPLDSGSGTFAATLTSTPGEYLITGMTGTSDGSSITALLPPGSFPGTVAPNDNLLYIPPSAVNDPPGSPASTVDLFGVSYVANGQDYNLFFGPDFVGDPFVYNITFGPGGAFDNELTSFTVVPASTSPVPEPGSLLLLGSGALGLFLIRRRFAVRQRAAVV